ncbi:MAG: Fibronectin type III domain protein [Candidatus Magasanikbacteria bacterium GW2011_GWC2_45_8]|uniref:Fibronectin type III domain protein n=1 Tax=Candidatus Magasanikbacteria bacterium GW2011_GWC2_45_8 TaxID=1619050 RepID=A0A0G1N085_9BACT|nr:MAG: Fibronectin type III domain protein [Candidatus Magasanikbacteria bacterium GW2011_GWC2_45_8]
MRIFQNKKRYHFLFVLIGVILLLPYFAYAITSTGSNTTSVGASVPSSGISGGSSVPLQPDTPIPPKDTTSPAAIANASAKNATSNSVTLEWAAPGDDGNTGTATSYSVRYALSAISSESAWSSATSASGVPTPAIAGTTQSVVVAGLNSQTTYYFAVRTTDEAGNQGGISNSPSAETLGADTTPPVISNVKVGISAHTVIIDWTTDENSDSQVAYGSTTGLGTIISNEPLVTDHSKTLSGLIANKKYYFLIHSTDASGNTGSGEITPFVTTKDATPPTNASQFNTSAGDGKVTLTWKNPGDNDFAGVKVQRAFFAAPQSPNEGQMVYNGSGFSVLDGGLQNGTTYYYTVFAYDLSGNYASGVTVSAIPSGSGTTATPIVEGSQQQTAAATGQAITGGSETANSSGGISGGGSASNQNLISDEILSQLSLTSITFLTAGESILVSPDQKGVVHIMAGQNFTLAIGESVLKNISFQQIIFQFNGDSYVMKKDERTATWRATVRMPEDKQKQEGVVKLFQTNTTVDLLSFGIVVEPQGLIYKEGTRGNESIALVDAALFKLNANSIWEKWASGVYNQQNPQNSGENGTYGWVVPAGTYFYRIEKTGFRVFESNKATIADGAILNNSVRLLEIPPSLSEAIKAGAPLQENIKNVAKNLGKQTTYISKIINQEVQQFAQNPEVQKTTELFAAPAVAGAAAVNVGTAVGLGQLIPYLRFLFTQPLLIFSRRRRKGWGLVYNSLTKVPLALATVRLIDSASGRIVQSRVTDSEGRYAFFVKQGAYKIQVNHGNFSFPSKFLAGLREDNQFIDLYHGEPIAVSLGGALVTANIPLDPVGVEKPAGKILRQLFWRRFQHGMSILSLILTGGFLIIKPSLVTMGITALQIAFYFLFRRLAIPRKPKSWGIVYEHTQKIPLANTIARIFDKKFNKLLETQVTDKTGKYAFLVGKNEYYVVFERPGYEKQTSNTIDLTKTMEPVSVVGFDVELEKQHIQEEINAKNEE